MKVLTKEDEDAHYREVLKGGLNGGMLGLGLGMGASVILSRRSHLFESLTVPFKAFFVTSTGTFLAIINADRRSRDFERQRYAGEYEDATAKRYREMQENLSTWEKTKVLAREYRYPIVMGSWAASMAGSLAIVSRDKYLTTAQKLVQARMYAQGLTLMILIATAAFEVSDARSREDLALDPKKEVHHEHYSGEDMWKGIYFPVRYS
jgi:hypothetical protein